MDDSSTSDPLRRHRIAVLGLLAGCLGFAVLSIPIARGTSWAWDLHLARWLHGQEATLHLTRFEGTFYWLSDNGLVPLFVLVVLVLIFSGRLGWTLFEVVAGIGLLGLDEVLKNAFARRSFRSALFWQDFRPTAGADGYGRPHFGHGGGGYSFPSGHSLVTMALLCSFLVFARGTRAVRPIAVVGAVLVASFGVLLVVFAAHYPTDVLAGWTVAVAWISALSLAAPDWLLEARLGRLRRARAASDPRSS